MKPRFLLIFFIFIAITPELSNGVSSMGNWVCQIDEEYPLEQSKPLAFFQQNILLPYDFHKFDYELSECKQLRGKISFVGSVENKKIYDVLYEIENDVRDVIKLVIVERNKGLYSPIYICLFSRDVGEILPSTIVKTNFGNTILSIRNHYDGTGNLFDETYFVLDDYPPKMLNLEKAFFDTIKKALPNGYGIRKGGLISNLKTLTYSSPVWKEEDGNGGPKGGWINIQYGIKGGDFTVVKYTYDKDKL